MKNFYRLIIFFVLFFFTYTKKLENTKNIISNKNSTSSIFEELIDNLKQTVVMIDINSDMQFFEETPTVSKATGFIINIELGLIATNKHVTRISPTTYRINFLNGNVEKGQVVYYDFYHDFGFIQLDLAKDPIKYRRSNLYKTLKQVELGSSYDLKINDDLMLIGNNEGVNYSIKYGNVVNLNVSNFNGIGSIILTNFDRTGGSSGSPVWGKDGKVVAIHAMGNKEASFEVPIDYLKDVMENFVENFKKKTKEDLFSYDKGFIGGFYSLVPVFKIQNNFKKKNLNEKEKNVINDFFNNVSKYQRDSEEVTEVIQINSIIPSIAINNQIKSGDIIMKIENKIIGNDLILLEKIINSKINKKVNLEIYRFGKVVILNEVDVISTKKEKINKFLKISNTILHDVNLYVRMTNPLIQEGVIVSKTGLGSPFNDVSIGQLLLKSFNSKNLIKIEDFVDEMKNKKNGNTDNMDILDLTSLTPNIYNFIIDFANVQEMYLYEFDNEKGMWSKRIIKLENRIISPNRNVEQKIVDYEEKVFNYKEYDRLRNEYNKLFLG